MNIQGVFLRVRNGSNGLLTDLAMAVGITMLCKRPLSFLAVLCVGILGVPLSTFSTPDTTTTVSYSAQEQYVKDLTVLASLPHRLSGTAQGKQSAQYIVSRLKASGIKNINTLDMQVWEQVLVKCQLNIEGTTIEAYPVRPNVIIPPNTPPEGLLGPIVYAANGDLAHYGSQSPKGAIVVLEYDCRDNWKMAFAMGAKAVAFLGSPSAGSSFLHVGVPANMVRIYIPENQAGILNLRKNYAQANIICQVRWQRGIGTNIIAMVPGTNPRFNPESGQPEAFALSAAFDSYGEVPQQSPNALGAANVAALLQTASFFNANRPLRNMIFMFVDGRTYEHQGARTIYSALLSATTDIQKWTKAITEELAFKTQMLAVIESSTRGGVGGKNQVRDAVLLNLEKVAEFERNDRNLELTQLRGAAVTEEQKKSMASAIGGADALVKGWDNTRRALSSRKFDLIAEENFSVLKSKARSVTAYRIDELKMLEKEASQQRSLRTALDSSWIALHIAYNFSDGGTFWGPILSANPEQYSRILKAFRAVTDKGSTGRLLLKGVIKDPLAGKQYVQGTYTDECPIASNYGTYNLSFMTCNDRRPRIGHPSDNIANLKHEKVWVQAEDALGVVLNLANRLDMSPDRALQVIPTRRLPEWNNNKSSGDYVALQITGGMSEDRAATGAMLAISGRQKANLWAVASTAGSIPAFEDFIVEAVDGNGHYPIVGAPFYFSDMLSTLAVQFDSTGGVAAISNNETMPTRSRVNLFPCYGNYAYFPLIAGTVDATVKIMDAAANAEYPDSRSLRGSVDGVVFFYLHKFDPVGRFKIFGINGLVALGSADKSAYGEGLSVADLKNAPLQSDDLTADNLWNLNETRLAILRNKKVSDVDLEVLHNRARQLLQDAEKSPTIQNAKALLAQSAAISRQIYQPLRSVMDDLVFSIVILLILSIPFAFALERLLICATSVYARLSGFAIFFFLTFGLLYLMHPGFSIAATPGIVFLAFILIILSGSVINIMARKFKTEIMAFQGRSSKVHNVEISRMGTLLTAVNMGMSTMRRRPIRTALTTITAIMLTFTILCFASFNNSRGVRSFYSGPANENSPATFLMRNVNYQPLNEGLLNTLVSRIGSDGILGAQYWVADRQTQIAITKIGSPEVAFLDALMGLSGREVNAWPALSKALDADGGAAVALDSNGVFLPSIVQKQLRLQPGDRITLGGLQTFFAGSFNESALQRIKHIDGQAVVPVNFSDPSYDTTQTTSTTASAAASEKIRVQKDFTRLGSNQIVVTSDILARQLGGSFYMASIYSGKNINVDSEGKRIAEITGLPLWARKSSGVERMIFTQLVEVSGGFALFVPLLLGGLIIFGTLLGSITDRQREIYTFSALGLGPAHVGFLFIAEAGVYAIVGGMGGELLAQAFAYIASFLANLGYIEQPSINFSSTHSLFAIMMVMILILASAIYPAVKASSSANPGIARSWRMPDPKGDLLDLTFPFTVSAYDITGVVSFLAEHFREHDDAGLGKFAAQNIAITRPAEGRIKLSAKLSLAPFDLGITENFSLTAVASEIPGVDEVLIHCQRLSGTGSDWHRANRVFISELRKQFLLWRTLSVEYIEQYRMQTLTELGEGRDQFKNGADLLPAEVLS